MIEKIDFETYLYILKNKFQITVIDKKNLKELFSQELNIYEEFNFQDMDNLSKFLDENIYKIEKLVGNFIENIILIIESNSNLNTDISIKKNNYGNFINKEHLESNLTELKDLFKENYQEQKIMHMVVKNYILDEKNYSKLIKNIRIHHFCLEVNFISISNEITFVLDKLLEKYQIKINQYMCGFYIKHFFNNKNNDLSLLVHKLKNGLNDDEVILVSKNIENKGFFERFFQLFS
jgi:hypothetical protein